MKSTATIVGINKEKMKATLKWADGQIEVVDVKEPEYLERVKTGDRIEIAHTQSVAVQVTGADTKK